MVTVCALNKLFDIGLSEEQIAKAAHASENRYVGVACGIMDQYASALCQEGQAMKLDCETGQWSHHKLPDGFCVVITDSGVKRKLTESRYNDRRMECQQALQLLIERGASVKNLCSATEEQVKNLLSDYPIAQKRARHCVTENKRMNDAVEALKTGDGIKFGALMNQCHWSLSRDFEVSHPALDALVAATEELEGCLGCRLTGAGFGGCTVALIQKDSNDEYVERVERAAREGGHPKPTSFTTDAGAGACQLGELL